MIIREVTAEVDDSIHVCRDGDDRLALYIEHRFVGYVDDAPLTEDHALGSMIDHAQRLNSEIRWLDSLNNR